MSIEKSPNLKGKYLQKALIDEMALKTPKKEVKKGEWLEKIHIQPCTLKCFKGKIIADPSPTSKVARDLLFPKPHYKEFIAIQQMPDKSLIEKMVKERAFRFLLTQEFEIQECVHDSNCGLRALIHAMNPDLDANSEKITAIVLRGDLIQFVQQNHQNYSWICDEDTLEEYCDLISKPDMPIGSQEMEIMSDLLKTPIHVFCYKDSWLTDEGELMPGEHRMYGSRYVNSAPISLYFNPLESRYFSLRRAL